MLSSGSISRLLRAASANSLALAIWALSPACSARYLGQNLKGIFSSAKVRPLESNISTHHPHQGDVGKIVAFGYHLSTNKNVGLTTPETSQKLSVGLLAPRSVSVHTTDPGLRKKTFHFRLHPLGAKAKGLECSSITLGARWGGCHGQAT